MPANAPYEYKVVPAPRAARRIKGARGPQERFARTLEEILAEEAVGGWEFLRAEHMEIDEKRSWLSRARPIHRSILVFRRATAMGAPAAAVSQTYMPQAHAQPGAYPAPTGYAQASAPAPAPASAAPAGLMDPDAAWARAQSSAQSQAAAPAAPQPAPYPRPEEPVLRLAPTGQPASLRPDPEVHPDPDAPRIGPAER
ncbi:MAG: hypothetical protein AAF763_10360 [Pseudomonadota bacterium]